MKRIALFILLFISLGLSANNYNIGVGQTMTLYCTANAPAGYITHCWWSVVDANDGEYVAFSYTPSDLYCTVYGLKAKANIKVEVTYAYSYLGSYDNNIHVGHASYFDYITVTGGVNPTSVSIDQGTDVHMAVGETITLTAKLTPNNASTSFDWGAVSGFGNPYYFDISYMGKFCYVTAKKPGYIQLACQTANGLVAFCKVTADDITPTTVRLPDQITVYMGEETDIKPVFTPSNAYAPIEWEVSESIINIIDKKIIPLAEGETSIKCYTQNGLESNYCTVHVEYREPEDIRFEADTFYLTPWTSKVLSCELFPNNAQTVLSWNLLEGENSVYVDEDGTVYAFDTGTAKVLVTTQNGLSAACIVVVTPQIESIIVPEQINMLLGEQYTLNPTVIPSDAHLDGVEWITADPNVVSIAGNTITAKGLGNTHITAFMGNNVIAKIPVYVKKMLFLNVWTNEKVRISLPLYDIPTIIYENDNIEISTYNRNFTFSLYDIAKITLADGNEKMEDTEDDRQSISEIAVPQNNLSIDKDKIIISSLADNDIVFVYSISGLLIHTTKADKDGIAQIYSSTIPSGMYIIKANNINFKIWVQ